MVNVYKGGIIMLKLIEIPESIKNIYLVDTENCYPEIISSKNNLYIYFLGHNKKINAETISNSESMLQFINCEANGKNALDFILVGYLSILADRFKNRNYYIYSNDKGYDSVISVIADICSVNIQRIKVEPLQEIERRIGDARLVGALKDSGLFEDAVKSLRTNTNLYEYLIAKYGYDEGIKLFSMFSETYNRRLRNKLRKQRKLERDRLIKNHFSEKQCEKIYKLNIVIEVEKCIKENLPLRDILVSKFGEERGTQLYKEYSV